MINNLLATKVVKELINNKRVLILAGEEKQLRSLPKGNWIGGTIPYFMAENGGCIDSERIFVNDITEYTKNIKIIDYNSETINTITTKNFAHGFTYLLLPGFSEVLSTYAMKAHEINSIYDIPLTGWVTGVHLDKLEKIKPKVFNGQTLEAKENTATAMHVELPADKVANLEIINIFSQGEGDTITFDEEGFCIENCIVNGKRQNFAQYLADNEIDTRLPLVADYSGAMINSSIQEIDTKNKKVMLYSPVKKGVEYKIAKPVHNYVDEFMSSLPKDIHEVASSFNCILNFLYSNLEGKKTGMMKGPFTFGEIAYILVNQTLVYLTIKDN